MLPIIPYYQNNFLHILGYVVCIVLLHSPKLTDPNTAGTDKILRHVNISLITAHLKVYHLTHDKYK